MTPELNHLIFSIQFDSYKAEEQKSDQKGACSPQVDDQCLIFSILYSADCKKPSFGRACQNVCFKLMSLDAALKSEVSILLSITKSLAGNEKIIEI